MKYVTIKRNQTGDMGTFGTVSIEDNPALLYTAELPWRNNEEGVSCIPPGQYVTKWVLSPKRQRNIYMLMGTDPRTAVEIHSGNWAGDKLKGYKSNVEGCILLGSSIGDLEGQKAVLESAASVVRFETIMNHEDFLLTIEDHTGAPA